MVSRSHGLSSCRRGSALDPTALPPRLGTDVPCTMIFHSLATTDFTLLGTPLTWAFSIVLVTVTAVLSFIIWKRSEKQRGVGAVELLRLLFVSLVALMFNQPECRTTIAPDARPTVAILLDGSLSMDTKDVKVSTEDRKTTSEQRNSRWDLISPLTDASAWTAANEDYEIKVETFATTTPQTEPLTETPVASRPPAAQESDIAAAIISASDRLAPRAIVVVSDGDWNAGQAPADAAVQMRIKGIPTFTVPVGSVIPQPDLKIESFQPPTFSVLGKPVRIPFRIASTLSTQESVSVRLKTSSGKTFTQSITLSPMSEQSGHFLLTPDREGEQTLTLSITELPVETDLDYNEMMAQMNVRPEELDVLVIESSPRWEYRFLRNALMRDPGVKVDCLLYHQKADQRSEETGYLATFPESSELSRYDVIFLGDVGISSSQLSEEDANAIFQHVASQAAGLVIMPGFQGYQQTLIDSPLTPLFPVEMNQSQPRGWGSTIPGRFELTELGAKSLLTRLADKERENAKLWNELPGFQWYAGVVRARPGSQVLAVHSMDANEHGRFPLIVTKTFGTGKVLFMGTDTAWRWRKGVEDLYHYRFWGQVARWMSYQRNLASGKGLRLFYSPERPVEGDTVTLNANVMGTSGEPLREGAVNVEVISPSDERSLARLQSSQMDGWGLFTGTTQPTEPGEHRIIVSVPETGATLETSLIVTPAARERVGDPANHESLIETAQLTDGRVIRQPTAEAILAAIGELPQPEPIIQRLRIWAHPAWVFSLIGLAIILWLARKRVGTI